MRSMLPLRSHAIHFIHHFHKPVSRSFVRRLVAFVVVLNLLLWPGPAVSARGFLISASDAGAQLFGASVTYLNQLTNNLIWFGSLFRSSQETARPETVADRNRLVSSVEVSPHKLVGYLGDTVTFVAMGRDLKGQIAHGAKFNWESSDPSKLKIDEAGRANSSPPG